MYSLNWSMSAAIDLATIWCDAADPAAVSRASAQAEAILRSYPFGQAVHVSEGLWRLTVRPLAVYFQLDANSRTVMIDSVGTTPDPPRTGKS